MPHEHTQDMYIAYLEAAMVIFDLMLCIFLRLQKRDETAVTRRFTQLLYVLTFGTLLDVVVSMGLNHPDLLPPFIFRVLRATNGITATVLGYMLLRYVLAFVRAKQDVKTEGLIALPLILCIGLWMTNPFTDSIINYRQGAESMRGPLFMTMHYYYPLIYIALSIACLILYRKRYEKVQRNALLCNLVFIVALYLVQMLLLPYLMITYYVGSVAAFTMFFALETPAYDRVLRAMDALEKTKKNADEMTERARNAEHKKTLFLRDMSQEMRVSVNTIVGMEEMIAKVATQGHIREYARQMSASSDRLNTIIQGIGEYTRIESAEQVVEEAPYEMAALLDGICVASYEEVHKKGLQFHVTVQGQMPSALLGDAERITRVVKILVQNAAKFTEEGTVSLIVSCEEMAERACLLQLKVTDTGRGIRAEDLQKLFVPFAKIGSRTENGGAGFGLLIAKVLTEQMKGAIAVTSKPLAGSAFTLSIPQRISNVAWMQPYDPTQLIARLERDATGLADEEMDRFKNIFDGKRILVIDDTSVVLTIMTGFLKGTGAQVDIGRSGSVCLMMAEKTPYDLIILDHLMPELDGVATLHLLREKEAEAGFASKEVPVIVMTANEGENLKEYYLNEGFTGYLAKPVRVRPLMDKLCDILLK